VAPALAPEQIERQVTYPLETAMAGIPGLTSTRSLSRNGFSQVTVIFTDQTDIYFARQQVAERLAQARESMPEGVEPALAPITTGLGEVLMWTVDYKPFNSQNMARPGQPGWQAGGNYLTPEGELLTTPQARATYLRTVQDWIIAPQMRTAPGLGVGPVERLDQVAHAEAVGRQARRVGADRILLHIAADGVDAGQAGRRPHLRGDDPVLHGA
jgi:heavy metal efflux system protein